MSARTVSVITGLVAAGAAAALALPLAQASVPAARHHDSASAHPSWTPGQFRNPQQNPWFPLRPGTVWKYRGSDEGQRYTERVVVTHRHKTIQGVRTRVIRDVVRRADDSVAEKTHDWYAADRDGRVWYFGEATATYDRAGNVEDRDGSWQAGVDGARAGVIMPAHPHVTAAYRQEFERGEAEDQAWIVQKNAHVATPATESRHAVRSLEWTRLEPNVVSVKFYVRGFGQVSEHDMSGGHEQFELTSMRHR